ncbi:MULTISPECIES: hypothetical protein [Paenibacillus]|uniref:Uncharacterized protein n=1 Tax=Paenibacillus naphthalenovorans TaxID=162209 RepID=A0A0U2UET0_9BACL|nr:MULTISPECIES: hypothetical protein [Paenibacillus]ALS24728.1 hypothetical protein IJ22_44420 [Paenibacillus naphthalenovorans]GCL73942.1 hypothetical protein PN4B1_38840 [Paenibacillus naphthalenovorans]SDJ06784.1 hypothetical protein SAMN05421868_11653 [Paenibacillus naphthalenovorans]
MRYAISYKGKILGEPMTREQAEVALMRLSLCFNNLKIVEVTSDSSTQALSAKYTG